MRTLTIVRAFDGLVPTRTELLYKVNNLRYLVRC